MLIAALILLSMITAALCIYLHAIKAELSKLADRLGFIGGNDTNMQLYTGINAKELNKLVLQVNKLIAGHNRQSMQIKQNERVFRQTITDLSHDLRTPLTSAAGYVQMIKSEKIPLHKKTAYIDTIERRIEHLRKMIDDLFEFSRLQSGEYELDMQKVDICSVICDVVSMYYDDLNARGIVPEISLVPEKCYIKADSGALRRIFENLISNSIRHGDGGLGISVSCAGGFVETRIENPAESLSAEDAGQLFNRFFTAGKTEKTRSTGLGLAIARELAVRMGGEIVAQLSGGCLIISLRYLLLS